jgi:uncharacterized protein
VEFEWDENKRQKVRAERGVDILYAALIFDGYVLTRKDTRDYANETRWISLGMVEDECFIVVHTQRNGATRLITAWKGGRDDRSCYEKSILERVEKNEGKG